MGWMDDWCLKLDKVLKDVRWIECTRLQFGGPGCMGCEYITRRTW